MARLKADADGRQETIEAVLHEAFARFIEVRETEVIVFAGISALDLAAALEVHPLILKPLLACCNVGGRALERDLNISIDTYGPRVTADYAKVVAGYLMPFLPSSMAVPALCLIDRFEYIDKEMRAEKGRWEQRVKVALNQHGHALFRKRKFAVDGEQYEIDVAHPPQGPITIGVDVKRIEARRDIHKRCDEIVNKASKLRIAFPQSRFGAVLYYPFVEEHANVQSRLRSPNIDGVVFASDTVESIENAVQMLLAIFGQVIPTNSAEPASGEGSQ